MTKTWIDTALALAGFIVLTAYTLIITWNIIILFLLILIIVTAARLRKPQMAYLLPLCWAFSLFGQSQTMSLQSIFAYAVFGIIPLLLTTQAAATFARNRTISIDYAGTIAALLPLPIVCLFLTANKKSFINTSAEMLSAAGVLSLIFMSIISLAMFAGMETQKNK
jgi:cellobiose-specific phosphotransferase system component IIC